MDFYNKVILVTGASSGMGKEIAIAFSKQGAKVAIVGRNAIKLKSTSDMCENVGSKPLNIIADITIDEDLKRIVETTVSSYGKIDVLVNCAGICNLQSITEHNAMLVFDQTMTTNLRALVYLTHLSSSHLSQTKGNIINISSAASNTIFFNNNFSYGTSKAAVDYFTKSIALELAPKGIRVNSINPGPVKTDFTDSLSTEETENLWYKLKNATALGKLSTTDEIADMVLFLASDKARSVTGSAFVIDNGIKLKGLID